MAAAQQDKITGGVVLIGAIFAVTIIAGLDDNLGRVLVIIFLGFILLWLMTTGGPEVQGWLGKIGP
jgi:VIT1/CCC1 family predicted Fe2+/Mn2+ transporter